MVTKARLFGQHGRPPTGLQFAGMTIVSGITNIQGSSEFSTTVYRRLIHLLLNVPPDFWAAFFYGSVLRQIDSTNHPHGFALRGTGGRR